MWTDFGGAVLGVPSETSGPLLARPRRNVMRPGPSFAAPEPTSASPSSKPCKLLSERRMRLRSAPRDGDPLSALLGEEDSVAVSVADACEVSEERACNCFHRSRLT